MKEQCTFKHNGKEYIALVRKFTERECFRLMGVDDPDIDKILSSGVGRTNCYKLAGNSIVVDVLYHIFRKMFIQTGNESSQLSLFEESYTPSYTKKNPLRAITLCSGYDSQCLALERLKRDFPDFDYELIAWAESDPESNLPLDKQPAVIAHNAIFPQWAGRNLGDITKINWNNIGGGCDLLFYSTPCQSISQAGLQHGFTEGSGTRSSIIWNVRDALIALKPKYACLENVAAMVSSKFKPMFNLWNSEVARMGYSNYSKLLNAKDYGVPQNRNRIFLVSVRDDVKMTFNFPEPLPLRNTLDSLLEECVDPRYYLNPSKVGEYINDNIMMVDKYMSEADEPIEKMPPQLQDWFDNYERNSANK